jgi:hypothetical protein
MRCKGEIGGVDGLVNTNEAGSEAIVQETATNLGVMCRSKNLKKRERKTAVG